jgi:cytoskeleton protein RodZ
VGTGDIFLNTIMTDTPGNILKNARELRNLNIAQVSKATRIRAYYIEAMEADRFADLPSPVHIKGFLRAYAEFLGFEGSDLISRIELPQNSMNSRIPVDSESAINDESNEKFATEPLSEQIPIFTPFQKPDEPFLEIKDEFTNYALPNSISSDQSKIHLELPGKSQLIFESIGEKLKNQREVLGLSLDEVEIHSHVRKHYLESIEAGDFEKLPSTVQARGMLSNYAHFLEIDQEEILMQYADGLQTQRIERQPSNNGNGVSTHPLFKISALHRYISIDLIFGGGLIILLITFAFWATGNVINLYKSPSSEVTAKSISDIILTPLQTLSPEGAILNQPALVSTSTTIFNNTAIPTAPGAVSGQVQVYVIVLQSAWLRVTVDGKIVFEGRVEPGSAFPYNGNNQIEILTGSGSAIQIVYNQTDLGVMGVFGEIVDRIYTQNSILVPTATITLIPTITFTPTITPRLSKTPLPTQTPNSSLNP